MEGRSPGTGVPMLDDGTVGVEFTTSASTVGSLNVTQNPTAPAARAFFDRWSCQGLRSS